MRIGPIALSLAAMAAALPSPSFAWGSEGHILIAAIARARLAPATIAKVDAILAQDSDTLTPPDMLSRATWADAWRGANHRETAQWHFVDIELDHPDLDAACFGHPAAAKPVSAGPAEDCVTDRVAAFAAELGAPDTAPAERVLALKYVLHFVGDLHQPLHVADNHDRGGNCVGIALGDQRTVNLHSYWDTVVIHELGEDPQKLFGQLNAAITPDQARDWASGDLRSWTLESNAVAVRTVYSFHTPPRCENGRAPLELPAGYDMAAKIAAATQLERAGVRLAVLLEKVLGPLTLDQLSAHPAQ